jgi:hypothetical protein
MGRKASSKKQNKAGQELRPHDPSTCVLVAQKKRDWPTWTERQKTSYTRERRIFILSILKKSMYFAPDHSLSRI